MKLFRDVWMVVFIGLACGCSAKATLQYDFFKKAQRTATESQDTLAFAISLLKSGASAQAVVDVLRRQGLSNDEATIVVSKAIVGLPEKKDDTKDITQ